MKIISKYITNTQRQTQEYYNFIDWMHNIGVRIEECHHPDHTMLYISVDTSQKCNEVNKASRICFG